MVHSVHAALRTDVIRIVLKFMYFRAGVTFHASRHLHGPHVTIALNDFLTYYDIMPCGTCKKCKPCPPPTNYKCTGAGCRCQTSRRIYSRWSDTPCQPTLLPKCGPVCQRVGTLQAATLDAGFMLTEYPGPLFGNRIPVTIQS